VRAESSFQKCLLAQKVYTTRRDAIMNTVPMNRRATLVLVLGALLNVACRSEATPKPKTPQVGWRPIGSWKGHGAAQTESFVIDSGQFRIKWETRNEKSQNSGTFRLTVHSAISGRPLALAVEHRGPGRDTAYINEDPRTFHLVIE